MVRTRGGQVAQVRSVGPNRVDTHQNTRHRLGIHLDGLFVCINFVARQRTRGCAQESPVAVLRNHPWLRSGITNSNSSYSRTANSLVIPCGEVQLCTDTLRVPCPPNPSTSTSILIALTNVQDAQEQMDSQAGSATHHGHRFAGEERYVRGLSCTCSRLP